MGHILGRVIATELIIGATICRTQEERLELRGIRLNAKGDPDEAPCELWGAGTGKAGQSGLDYAVPEFGTRQDCDWLDVGFGVIRLEESDGAATSVGDEPRIDVPELKLSGRGKLQGALVG